MRPSYLYNENPCTGKMATLFWYGPQAVRNFVTVIGEVWHVACELVPVHLISLQWRHNDHDSVSNHQPYDCLLNRLFRRRSKKTSKLRVTGLCVGNSPGPVNSPHKGPVTRKMFPFDDVIMFHWKRKSPLIHKLSVVSHIVQFAGHQHLFKPMKWFHLLFGSKIICRSIFNPGLCWVSTERSSAYAWYVPLFLTKHHSIFVSYNKCHNKSFRNICCKGIDKDPLSTLKPLTMFSEYQYRSLKTVMLRFIIFPMTSVGVPLYVTCWRTLEAKHYRTPS